MTMIIDLPRWRPCWPLAAVIAIFTIVVIMVNPLREMPIKDDWAYALTVRTLVQTGEYHLHDWSAPNLIFQAYYGSLFVRLLGMSFSSLRLSTLSLLLVGLISFYFLSREFELSHWQSALLTVLLMASPLVLKFSFSFMTNVPFLSCALLALWLYTRALRLRSYPLMILASAAAAAATLTRQFGMAFVPGLLLVWLCPQDRRRSLPLISVGLILPVVASIWQLYAGFVTPNWTVLQHRIAETRFLAQPDLVPELLWRLATTLIYLALFGLPLLIPAFAEYANELRASRGMPVTPRIRLNLILMLVPTLFILGMLTYGTFVMGKIGVMPILPWNFTVFSDYWPRPLAALLTLVMIIGGVLLARLFALRYFAVTGVQTIPPSHLLLDFVTLGFLALHVVFLFFRDEYLITLLPFTLIVLGRALQPWLERLRVPLIAASLVFLIVSTLWVREYIEEKEAEWQAAQSLVDAGIDPFQIDVSWEWTSYHGGFDAYLKEINYQQPAGDELLSDYFDRWIAQRLAHAPYLVGALAEPPNNPQFEIVRTVPYQDVLLRPRYVYILKHASP